MQRMDRKKGWLEAGREHFRKAGLRIRKDVRAYWGFAVVFVLYDLASNLLFGAFCPSVIAAGLPCPGCGMTRAVLAFLTGQPEKGMQMNPLGIAWILWTLYFAVMRYVFGKKAKGLMTAAGGIVVMMIVVYGWRMYLDFPGKPPICYTPGNLLERVVPGYENLVMGVWEAIRG